MFFVLRFINFAKLYSAMQLAFATSMVTQREFSGLKLITTLDAFINISFSLEFPTVYLNIKLILIIITILNGIFLKRFSKICTDGNMYINKFLQLFFFP